jgi:predicted RNA-binding protein YlxR (DUF448 family)
VGCRAVRDKRELTRIVRTPDGHVVLDPTGRLAGRGAYLCDDPACREAAMKKSALSRALAAPIPDALRAELLVTAAPTAMTKDEGGARGQE